MAALTVTIQRLLAKPATVARKTLAYDFFLILLAPQRAKSDGQSFEIDGYHAILAIPQRQGQSDEYW